MSGPIKSSSSIINTPQPAPTSKYLKQTNAAPPAALTSSSYQAQNSPSLPPPPSKGGAIWNSIYPISVAANATNGVSVGKRFLAVDELRINLLHLNAIKANLIAEYFNARNGPAYLDFSKAEKYADRQFKPIGKLISEIKRIYPNTSVLSDNALIQLNSLNRALEKLIDSNPLYNVSSIREFVARVNLSKVVVHSPVAQVVKPVVKYGGPVLAVVGAGVATSHAVETVQRRKVGIGEKVASVGTAGLSGASALGVGAAAVCAVPVVGNATCVAVGTGVGIGAGIGAVGMERIEHYERGSRVAASLGVAFGKRDARLLNEFAADPHGDMDDDAVVATFEKLIERNDPVLKDARFWTSIQPLVRKMIDALAGSRESTVDRTLNYISDYEGALLLVLGQYSTGEEDLQYAISRLHSGLTGEWGDEKEYDQIRAKFGLPSVEDLLREV